MNHERQTANHELRTAKQRLRGVFSEYLVLFLCLAYFLAMVPFVPGFASADNLANILASMAPLLIVAIGQTIVLITAGIDLSVTSIIGLTSVLGAFAMNGETGWLAGNSSSVPVAIVLMLLVGAGVGFLNGAAVTWFSMPAFIVTLTSMMFFRGLAIWLTQSKTIFNLPPAFNAIGGLTWHQVPVLAVPCAGLLAALAHLALSRSVPGRWLYSVGHNPKTAAISGVPVNGVILAAYVASGLCAATASILYTGRLETGSPVHGERILLDVIGATVIGGTSLFGGKGKVLWTVFGVLFLTLIDSSLNLLNLSYFTIMMVKGAVILLAALLDTLRNRMLAS